LARSNRARGYGPETRNPATTGDRVTAKQRRFARWVDSPLRVVVTGLSVRLCITRRTDHTPRHDGAQVSRHDDGGGVRDSRKKTAYLVGIAAEELKRSSPSGALNFVTLTFAENVTDKEAAMKCWHRLAERIRRRYPQLRGVGVWQRQKRGAWHPHCLVNHYIDVNQLRPWMVARGWGQQMRADIVGGGQISTGGRNGRGVWRPQWEGGGRIISYLTKYLTKGFGSSTDRAAAAKKKCFSGSVSVKKGTTNFKWMPEERPGAYLWSWGRELFSQLNGHPPTFRNIGEVIRLGVEHSGWANVDPWWTFNFRGG